MLKWPPDQAFKTDVNLILLALEAHTAMLKALFSTDPPDGQPPKPQKGMSATGWQAFSRTHNLRYQRPRGRRPVAPAKRKGGAGGG